MNETIQCRIELDPKDVQEILVKWAKEELRSKGYEFECIHVEGIFPAVNFYGAMKGRSLVFHRPGIKLD